MENVEILVVEDEGIVARHLQQALKTLGYCVPVTVASGEDAIQKAIERRPGLVLMDIVLKGEMDGIEAAERIRASCDIPVIFLTAHADAKTLQRAKLTESYGYILKPFEEREVTITIEMALYKHGMEKRLRESEERYRAIAEVVSDYAYVTRVEADGTIVPEWITQAFTRVTGCALDDFEMLDGLQGLVHPDDIPIAKQRVQNLLSGRPEASEFRIVTRDGDVRWIRDYARPVWDESEGRVVRIHGAAQDITERKRAEEEREKLIRGLEGALAEVKKLSGLLPICASCKKIRDDYGYWTQVEVYVRDHSEVEFSHALCPDCQWKLYPPEEYPFLYEDHG